MIAEYGHLLAAADVGMPPYLMLDVLQAEQHAGDEQPGLVRPPGRLGAISVTIAVALIALHAICAAVIIDRALAHAPESVAVDRGD